VGRAVGQAAPAERLAGQATSTVVDAMIRTGTLRPESTVMRGLHQLTGGSGTVVGRARTAQFGLERVRGQAALVVNRKFHFSLVDDAEIEDALVLAAPPGGDFAIFGGLLGAKAASRGVKVVVVDGFTRDVAECADHGLVVWARGRTPVPGGHGDYSLVAVNTPVACAGVAVHPADWLVADGDGVVVVPDAALGVVLDACDEITDSEQRALEQVRSGEPLHTAYPSRDYYKQSRSS
jgi:regulator of RNase E activity RraA